MIICKSIEREDDKTYMDYRELFKESNKEVEERFLLTKERIEEIAAGEESGMRE